MSCLNLPPSPLRIIFQDLPLAGCGKLQVKSQLSTEDGATEQQVGGTVCVPVSVTGSETLSSEGGSRHPNSPRDPTPCSAGEKSTCGNAAGQLTGLSLQVPLSRLDVGHCKKTMHLLVWLLHGPGDGASQQPQPQLHSRPVAGRVPCGISRAAPALRTAEEAGFTPTPGATPRKSLRAANRIGTTRLNSEIFRGGGGWL